MLLRDIEMIFFSHVILETLKKMQSPADVFNSQTVMKNTLLQTVKDNDIAYAQTVTMLNTIINLAKTAGSSSAFSTSLYNYLNSANTIQYPSPKNYLLKPAEYIVGII